MALVLRNAALQKNVSLLKCIKTRTVVTTANKNNNQAPLSATVTSSLTDMNMGTDGWTRPLDLDSIGTQGKTTLMRSSSCPKLSSSGQLLFTILTTSQFLAPAKPFTQRRSYACNPPACCLPPPCNTPPRCLQYMSGYYYYPYGTWFCGPYHDQKCCPISKGACCCAACLAAQGAVANASISTAVSAPIASYAHAAAANCARAATANYANVATAWSNQAAQMAYAMRARAQTQAASQEASQAAQAEPAEASPAQPETIPIELPSGKAQEKTEEDKKPGSPPDPNPPVKPPHFSRFYPFP